MGTLFVALEPLERQTDWGSLDDANLVGLDGRIGELTKPDKGVVIDILL